MAQPPPDLRGVGFGSFILGLLLLGGVLGLVYLFTSSVDGLPSLASGGPTRPSAATATPEPGTAVAALPPVPDVLGKTDVPRPAAGPGRVYGPAAQQRHDHGRLVLEQFPPPNVPVEQSPATTITLTLSLGPELVDVPGRAAHPRLGRA